MAETNADAGATFGAFITSYQMKYDTAGGAKEKAVDNLAPRYCRGAVLP
jgi:hypothetical protein